MDNYYQETDNTKYCIRHIEIDRHMYICMFLTASVVSIHVLYKILLTDIKSITKLTHAESYLMGKDLKYMTNKSARIGYNGFFFSTSIDVTK